MARVRGMGLGRLDELGDRYVDLMTKAIRDVTRDAAGDVTNLDNLAAIPPLWNAQVTQRLLPALGESFEEGAEYVHAQLESHARRLGGERAITAAIQIPPLINELMLAYLRLRRNMLAGIANEIWSVIRESLVTGARKGESIAQLRDRVSESIQVAAHRAEAIARTEVIGAANAGSYEQMMSTGWDGTKEWIATNDSRTRPSHDAVDGAEIDIRAKFMVGGWPMARPHDPTAPPGEVINCRCTIAFEIADEEFEDDDE